MIAFAAKLSLATDEPPEESAETTAPARETSVAAAQPALEETVPAEPDCPRDSESTKLGSFMSPANVPAYTVLDEKSAGRGCVRAIRLLIDTPARCEEDLALITRDIKAANTDLDAITVEFTDSTSSLVYTGGAIIFNTPEGVAYMGYIHGPPNNEGYAVRAAD